VRLHGEMADWFDARGLQAHVTVTDETDYVATFVVVSRRRRRDPMTSAAPIVLDIAGTTLSAADRRRLRTRWWAA
jgi:hypothetical protein